jgi:hypothetical protein
MLKGLTLLSRLMARTDAQILINTANSKPVNGQFML